MRTPQSFPETSRLRHDLFSTWRAGLDGVAVDHLIRSTVRFDPNGALVVDGRVYAVDSRSRIVVIGAGKASGRMAAALENLIGEQEERNPRLRHIVEGWVNVPEDCAPPHVAPLRRIVLHGARPAGLNEPVEAGVAGTLKMLDILKSLEPGDLCFCVLSGGGSALMPAPVAGVTLPEKQELTRSLAAAGANIEELNIVRKQLSRVKGGGLLGATRARMVSLILSDVLGDPLDIIASGPTVPDSHTASDALAVLDRYGIALFATRALIDKRVGNSQGASVAETVASRQTVLIGNNATAVEAAGKEAERLGYVVSLACSRQSEGPVEGVASQLLETALEMKRLRADGHSGAFDCLISGGEPTVKLVPSDQRGRGGRNQQLVLACLVDLLDAGWLDGTDDPGFVLLSCGTDGEDGPTDAAGAFFDAEIIAAMRRLQLDPRPFLSRNDAYRFFEQTGGLVKTGPTGTNVCDLRIVLQGRRENQT